MTIGHKIRLIPAKIRWFMGDIVGGAFYYHRYKSLKMFVNRLEQEYLAEEKKLENKSPEFIEKKARYELGMTILKGKYNG